MDYREHGEHRNRAVESSGVALTAALLVDGAGTEDVVPGTSNALSA